jgi:hypothetical protein
MHKNGSADMRHKTRAGRMEAKRIIAKALRHKDEIDTLDVPVKIRGGWMA